MPNTDTSYSLKIDIQHQTLTLYDREEPLLSYSVSTALNGPGETSGSGCTPRGQHIIRAKIGRDQPRNSVFVARRPTGEIYSEDLAKQYPQRDWILSRILWLSGTQPAINRLGSVDTMRRYIYIHGTPDTEPMGIPLSHGCIRMRNEDIEELFDKVSVGACVTIS